MIKGSCVLVDYQTKNGVARELPISKLILLHNREKALLCVGNCVMCVTRGVLPLILARCVPRRVINKDPRYERLRSLSFRLSYNLCFVVLIKGNANLDPIYDPTRSTMPTRAKFTDWEPQKPYLIPRHIPIRIQPIHRNTSEYLSPPPAPGALPLEFCSLSMSWCALPPEWCILWIGSS